MAAIAQNTNDANRWTRYLESLVLVNQTGGGAVGVANKYIRVPGRARYAQFLLFLTSTGGTTPALLVELNIPDISTPAKLAAPTDDNVKPIGEFVFTSISGAGPYVQNIDIGPDLVLDSTGNAAADAHYSIPAILPPVIQYRIVVDGVTGDEDYTAQLLVLFREN